MSEQPGYRWTVVQGFSKPTMVSCSDQPGWSRMDPKTEPDYFLVADAFDWDIERGRFDNAAEAEALAARLNREDAQRDLDPDPVYVLRRERLRELGETFSVRYGGQGHPESRWPSRPGPYAVESFSERYGETFWATCETRDEVEDEVRTGDVWRIVDLDSGEDVEFAVEAKLSWP